MLTITIPRESNEFVGVRLTPAGGEPLAAGVEVTTTTDTERPTGWAPAVVLDGQAGILTGALGKGRHTVWARHTSNPETIVRAAGLIVIT